LKYELIVGLEIHAQLITSTKAFCRCPNRFGDPPNTLTCPTCLGMPGALPVLNDEVVRQAAKLALALNATIHGQSKFDRKNYFYPDLPKGYQISQYDEPFSSGGYVDIGVEGAEKRICITRAHIEEDAGKSMHLEDGTTVVDMNRCGVPLVEIVSEPDFRTAHEAGTYLTGLRQLMRYVGVCDGNMERGSLRCDANVSARPVGQSALNERTEMKNLNSIRAVERAIQTEFDRQVAIYESGGSVQRETMLWDEFKEELRPMRRKEGSDDYRYFPEPDLVELRISAEHIEDIRETLPELPAQRKRRYAEELKLGEEAVSFLTSDRSIGDYFENLMALGIEANTAAKWVQGDVGRALNENDWTIETFPLVPGRLADLIRAVETDTISYSKAKQVFRVLLTSGQTVADAIAAEGGGQITDADDLKGVLATVLARHPDAITRYRAGKKNLFGFFVGEAMKATSGRANPKIINQLLQELLDSDS
jgi:aspartyl-tRNA(Asn)/glutamyl-tRNA(Gln) amidotransferase subunit B